MDKEVKAGALAPAADAAEDLTEAQRGELLGRSEAHRRNPDEAVPLDDALRRIERSLG